MPGFTKLVPEIVQSSIWNESSDIRVVWITLLAVKDENGYVRGTEETIARIANVPIESARLALEKFQLADVNSNTPDNEGRRIERHNGGWIILNHALYRTGDRNEYMREYMRKRRNSGKKKKVNKHVNSVNVNNNISSASVSVSSSEYLKEGDARGSDFKENPRVIQKEHMPVNLDNQDFKRAWELWLQFRKEAKKKLTPSTAKAQISKLSAMGCALAIESINQSITNGWQGLFEVKKSGRLSTSEPTCARCGGIRRQCVCDAGFKEKN